MDDSNGEFEMATNSPNNSFVEDGKLYIVPTLTSDVIGRQNVLNGYTYNITGCTNANRASLSLPFSSLLTNPPFSSLLTNPSSPPLFSCVRSLARQ